MIAPIVPNDTPPKSGDRIKPLFKTNLHSSEPKFKNHHSRFIIQLGFLEDVQNMNDIYCNQKLRGKV